MHLFTLRYFNLFLYHSTYLDYFDDCDIESAFSDYFKNFPYLNIIIKDYCFHILFVIIIVIVKFCRFLNHIHFTILEDH
jgi:hypothetical protein